MVMFNTLYLSRNTGSLELYDPNKQQTIKLTLFKPWICFSFSKISFLTHVRVIDAFKTLETEFETTPDTLIIINPNILINARTMQIAKKQNILRCPACDQAYHKHHREEWLLTNETCAICQSTIKLAY